MVTMDDLFERGTQELQEIPERVILIDLNSMARTAFGSRNSYSLSTIIEPTPGHRVRLETSMINNVVKNIATMSAKGKYAVYCFRDSSLVSRKVYMSKTVKDSEGNLMPYKGDRPQTSGDFFNEMKILENIIKASGIPLAQKDNFEADDLLYAVAMDIYEKHPNVHIDVIANDSDYVPMACDRISVYLKSRKLTSYEKGHPRRTGYAQVTPETYQEIVEGLSSTKNIPVPYNSLLLAKLIRGDSDNVPIVSKDWKPALYREFIEVCGGTLDLPYEVQKKEIFSKTTGEIVENIKDYKGDKKDLRLRYLYSDKIDNICKAIDLFEAAKNKQIEEENELIRTSKERTGRKSTKKIKEPLNLRSKEVKERFLGMNLNGAFTSEMGLDRNQLRKPFKPDINELTYFDFKALQRECLQLEINIKD